MSGSEFHGLSFALTVLAGLFASLGSAAFLTHRLISLIRQRNLAIALSLSAGVMIVISLMELQIAGIHATMNSIGTIEKKHSEDGHDDHDEHKDGHANHGLNRNLQCDSTCEGKAYLICAFSFGVGCIVIIMLKSFASKLWADASNAVQIEDLLELRSTPESSKGAEEHKMTLQESPKNFSPDCVGYLEEQPSPLTSKRDQNTKHNYQNASLFTAMFLGINNLPNGFAIYLSTVSDVHLGIILTLAIVLYNFAEGICISTPIFYSTGNRMISFCWTLPIALASPIGGVIAYFALGSRRGSIAEGIMFAIVAGMMVTNSIQELLPTARRFAPNKNYVTYSFMFGVVSIMIVVSSFVYMGI